MVLWVLLKLEEESVKEIEIGGALTSPNAPKQYPIHGLPELSATFKWYTDRG